MKILYIGSTLSTDSDLPLIRALQKKADIEIVYIICSSYWSRRGGVIDIKSIPWKAGIIPATEFSDMNMYRGYLDLSKVFFLYKPIKHNSLSFLVEWYIKRSLKLIYTKFSPDIVHFVWPRTNSIYGWLYNESVHKVQTVHDPIPHSNQLCYEIERERQFIFSIVDRCILLNGVQKEEFKEKYNIHEQKVMVTRMGEFDYLDYLGVKKEQPFKYILFFGRIEAYKGVEYLLEAMPEIHQIHPEIKLIVAGGGNFYFNIEKYRKFDYIDIRNTYMSLSDLATLITNAEFAVCPYKDATQSGVVQTAFSLGLPLIVTNVGALPTVVLDGINGTVIPPCNVDAIVNACVELLNDHNKLNEYRKNICNNWKKKQSWEDIADEYVNCYRDILRD